MKEIGKDTEFVGTLHRVWRSVETVKKKYWEGDALRINVGSSSDKKEP